METKYNLNLATYTLGLLKTDVDSLFQSYKSMKEIIKFKLCLNNEIRIMYNIASQIFQLTTKQIKTCHFNSKA